MTKAVDEILIELLKIRMELLERHITLLENKVESLVIDKRYYKGRYEQLKKEAK